MKFRFSRSRPRPSRRISSGAILEGTGTYSYFWKEQLQKKGIFVLVADQGMVKSTRRSLGGTDNKDDEFDALVMCELYRRHYLEIYDRRFWVKELNPKIQEIAAYIARPQNNHPETNQFHQYYQGTASVGISSARHSSKSATQRVFTNRTTACFLGLACRSRRFLSKAFFLISKPLPKGARVRSS
jgi:hypothetical protein